MKKTKINIRSVSYSELEEKLLILEEKKYRVKQIYEWLWKKSVVNFEEMRNLPKALIEKLNSIFYIDSISLKDSQISSDKTIKCAFSVGDFGVIEGVLIPTENRSTACISSQIGCSLDCKFCATGKLKLLKNLSPGEIYDQLVYLKKFSEENYNQNLTNIVYMGMGEPLLNYKNVLQSIDVLTSEKGLNISPKRITVSTAGIAKMIKKLADDNVKFNLALSLHAANDKKRSEIMQINDTNNLEALEDSLRYFYQKTRTRITFEYIIFRDFNDKLEDAIELAQFAKNVPCKVNIIEYNPIENGHFRQADYKNVKAFSEYLESKNLIVNIRRSRGKDIDAACGQLANKNEAILKNERVFK